MDQCKHCEVRGDMKKCMELDCSQHVNWYAVQLRLEKQRKLNELVNVITSMEVEENCPNTDNLAVALCTYFSDVYPEDETETDSGWSHTVDEKYHKFVDSLRSQINHI